MKRVAITEPAEAEYREAVAWYGERDLRVSLRFAAETRRALELVEAFPQIGGRVAGIRDPAVRQLPIHSFPYNLIFVDLGERIEVVAFAHYRRRPGYFVDRLRRT